MSETTGVNEVDQWMSFTARGARESAYQMGRLFNRFCFHLDQAYAAYFYQHSLASSEKKNAVLVLEEIINQARRAQPSKSQRIIPIVDFREDIRDRSFLAKEFKSVIENCNAHGIDPCEGVFFDQSAERKDRLRLIILKLISKPRRQVFELGFAVDQVACPSRAAEELFGVMIRGDVDDPQSIAFIPGQLPPDAACLRQLAWHLAKGGFSVKADRSIGQQIDGTLLFQIDKLDSAIRSELIVDTSKSNKPRLTVDLENSRATLADRTFELKDNSAVFLQALKQSFDNPLTRGNILSGPKIGNALKQPVPNFRSDRAFAKLPKEIKELIERCGKQGFRLKQSLA